MSNNNEQEKGSINELVDIHNLLKELSEKRKLFHSEADFQHELAIILRDELKPTKIRLEYPMLVEYPSYVEDKEYPEKIKEFMHLDIFLELKDKKKVGIELKYKTHKAEITSDDEGFLLKQHAAHGSSRYGFLKDIERLEKMKLNKKIDFGFAIFLTNDTALYTENKKNGRQGLLYLNPGKILEKELELKFIYDKTNLKYEKTLGDKKIPIILRNSYKIQWNNYSNNDSLKYMVIKVVK